MHLALEHFQQDSDLPVDAVVHLVPPCSLGCYAHQSSPCGQVTECTLNLAACWRLALLRLLTGKLCMVERKMGLAPGNFQSEEGRALVDKYHARFVAGLQQVRTQPCLHCCVHAEQVGLEAGAGG